MVISDCDIKLVPNLLGISRFITVSYKSWDRDRSDSDFPIYKLSWDVYGEDMQRMRAPIKMNDEISWGGRRVDIRARLIDEEIKAIDR